MFKSQYFFILVAFFALSGCVTTQNPQTKDILNPLSSEKGYKRSIQFVTNDPEISAIFQTTAARMFPGLVVFPEGSYSEFRLVLSKNVERVKSLETKPRLFGLIQKDETPVNYKLNYSLQKASAHVLDGGTVEQLTETKAAVYPRLAYRTEIERDKLEVIATQVLKNISKSIGATPWSAEIIGQTDPFNVTMSGNSALGIKIGDRFITKTQPISELELVMFEKTAGGEERPVLRLLSGPLPTTGRSLAPTTSDKPKETPASARPILR